VPERSAVIDRVPVDQAAREAALAPERSFIVQAPAGSGKTELLTQRFLRLLASAERPEEIVAITFTRKAAGEMRLRILDALHLGGMESPPAESHLQRTWSLARAALSRDRALGWKLLDSPRRLRVETIDALNAWLARQLPLSSRLGAPPVIAQDPEPAYREAAREILLAAGGAEAHSPHASALLAHLCGRFSQAEALLIALLKGRDHWLGKIVGGRAAGPGVLRERLDTALRHFIEDELRRVHDELPQAVLDEMMELCAEAATRAPGIESLACLAGATGLPQPSCTELPRWCALAELLLTRSGTWRKSLTRTNGFPPDARAAKERMLVLLQQLTETIDPAGLHRVRALPAPAYDDARWEILRHLLALLPVCAAELNLRFAARGESDFIGISRAALDALGPPEAPTDLALALDCRIRHVLVDEFQDTSQAQVELLERLTAGWMPGDGRSLFCVGDPMQSIYRFREADVGRFLKAQKTGIGGLPLEPLRLQVNFRSQAALVDWVSRSFPAIFPARPDLSLGAVPFSASTPWHPPVAGAAVECIAVPARDALAEAAAVTAIVQRIRAEAPTASIAVLVRSRRHLVHITPALKAAGVACQAVEIERLAEGAAIRDLEALTRALCHRADRTAWLALLRAPYCGLLLADLLILAGTRHDDIWSRLADPGVRQQLGEDGRCRAERLAEALAPALAERGKRPLGRVVEGAWLALGGPATVERASELDDARAFLEFIDSRARHGDLDDPPALGTLLAELYAAPESVPRQAVQLLTIHKAKGLEFDHVVLPGLDRMSGRGEKRLLRWLELVREGGDELILAPVERLGEERDELHRALRELEGRRELLELDRVLYVAATRARRRLHLVAGIAADDPESGEPPVPRGGTLLARLWPALGGSFLAARPLASPPGSVEAARPAAVLRRFPADWNAPELPPPPAWTGDDAESAVPDEAVEFDWAGREARGMGIAVHRMLQIIGREGAIAWRGGRLAQSGPLLAILLREAGTGPAELAVAQARCMAALERTLADSRGAWLLHPGHAQCASERRISGRLDGQVFHGVVDRSFVDDAGVLWIVDYKSGRHEGGATEAFLDREEERYRPQLERYARVLRQQHQGPIRLGLYFPQHAGWREWPAPAR
jgi:ATP-dependent helicase/nuclease subunit A